MPGDGFVVGLALDPAAVAGEVPPVQQHRTEAGHQAVGDVARLPVGMRFSLGQHRAQHGTAGAQHVHGVGIGGDQLECVGDDGRQAAQALQLGAVGLQLCSRGQLPVHEQVRHFLERALLGEVLDVVAAVMQVVAAAADRAQGGVARGRAAEGDGLLALGDRAGFGRGRWYGLAHAQLSFFSLANRASSLSS